MTDPNQSNPTPTPTTPATDADSEHHKCGRREEMPYIPKGIPEFDTWRKLPNGDRTCSFCGSLHHDDFLRLARDAADPTKPVWVEKATGKNYKYYVHQKDVENAMVGGIKFYTQHTPDQAWVDEINAIFKDTIEQSNLKIQAHLKSFRQSLEGKKPN